MIKKIFITGNSRCGTKLMGRCLKRHSQIHTLREVHFFDQIVTNPNQKINYSKANKLLKKLCLNLNQNIHVDASLNIHQKETSAIELYNHFLHYVIKQKNKSIACDPTPRYLFYIEELKKAYTDACFIAMIRDVRAVLWSQKNKWKLLKSGKQRNRLEIIRSFFNYHPIITSYIWKRNASEIKKQMVRMNNSVIVIKYEDFIQNPESTLIKITQQCELKFEDQMLNVRVLNTSDVRQLGNTGFDKTRIDSWKHNLCYTDIWIAQKICKREIYESGYKPIEINPNFTVLLIKILYLPLLLIISFFINILNTWKIVFFVRNKLFK